MSLTELRTKTIDIDNSLVEIRDYLRDVLESNDLMMHLASNLLRYHALNEEKLNNSFVAKKIVYNIQEIDRLFSLVMKKTDELDLPDTFSILSSVKEMFSAQYHSIIVRRIRNGALQFCLNWILKLVDFEMKDDENEMRDQPINYDAFLNARNYEKIRFMAITTLCQYFYYDGENTNDILEKLTRIDFYMDDNIDLHTIFEVIELFSEQNALPHAAVKWIWKGIIQICNMYKNHLYIMGRLCEKLDKIVKISRDFPDHTSSICVLFKAYAALCSDDDPRFNREVSVLFLDKFAWFHQNYFKLCYDESVVKFMYNVIISRFLNSNSFEIKMAAIKCFSTIMKFDIDAEIDVNDMEIVTSCRNDLFKFFREQILDESEAEPAFRIQLCTSLFCASFHLRKPMIFEISRLFYVHKVTLEVSKDCFEKILKFLKCEASSLMDNNSLLCIISQWVLNNISITFFPYYFTGSASYNEFLEKYYYTILLALMKNNCSLVDVYIESSSGDDFNIKDAFIGVIGDCLAFLIPIKAGCEDIRYGAKAAELQIKTNEVLTKNEQNEKLEELLPEVIHKILVNLIDVEKFQQISGLKFDLYAQDESINLAGFQRCIRYLNTKLGVNKSNFMTYMCTDQIKYIENLFMLQRSRIQSTELKEHKILYLLQYCILVEQTFDYMKDKSIHRNVSIKEFLMNEFVSYLTFLICDRTYGTKLRETAVNFFAKCLNELIPSCVEEFKPQMSKIMPNLVTIAQNDEKMEIKLKSLEIINFLVNQPLLSNEVAKIDRFPMGFAELRSYQRDIKYSMKDFTLTDEIEYFLSVKNRKVEGLKELSEHLVDKKAELKTLFDEVQVRGNESLLCQLLHSLISYIQLPSDDQRAVEAIKCLGEIGSHNLSKIAFNADDTIIYQNIASVQHCQKFFCHKFLNHMEELLLHSDPKVFEAASQACHHIFLTLSSQGYPDNPLLRPFQHTNEKEIHLFYVVPKIDKLCDIDIKKFFENNKTIAYENWLRELCIMMMKFAGDKVLSLIPSLPLSIAEDINSQMFQVLVYYDREEVNMELLKGINFFFSECNEALNYKKKTNEGLIFIDKRAIREMLKFTEVIRIFVQNKTKSNMSQVSNLNHLHIAKAAKHCEASFTAIMYSEMWAQAELDKDEKKTFKISIENKTLKDVMNNSYSAIGIKDAADIFLDPFANRSAYLLNMQQNFQLLLETESENTSDLAKICYEIGLYHLMNKFTDQTKDQDKSKQYDCLWRLCQWDVVVETEQELKDENGLDLDGEFNKYHYLGLQCLKNGDELGTNGAIDKARNIILQLLSQQSLECTKTLYKYMEMSHRLVQIEDFTKVIFLTTSTNL